MAHQFIKIPEGVPAPSPTPRPSGILWPDGVQAGGLLKKAHDLAWLKELWASLKLENGMILLY